MNKLVVLLVVLFALLAEATADLARTHEQFKASVTGSYEPYMAAFISLVLLITTLI